MDVTELVRTFFEDVLTKGEMDRCADLVAPLYVEHAVAPFGSHEAGPVDGPQHLVATAGWLRDQFPDIRMEIEQVVAQGDRIAVLVRSTGTNLGRLNGVIPPTGRSFSTRQSHWFRVEGGRLAEHWATREDLPAMLQLGVVDSPAPPAA
jgi:predicted ester cyclase